jgi:hypothetical protein
MLIDTETRETPDPYPQYPGPWTGVQGIAGRGTGWPGVPQGYPCYSLPPECGTILKNLGNELKSTYRNSRICFSTHQNVHFWAISFEHIYETVSQFLV